MRIIKKASANDINILNEISQNSFKHPWSQKSLLCTFKEKDKEFYVCKNGKIIVGYLILKKEKDFLTICNMAVANEFRRRGIGSSLIKFSIQKAQALGLFKIALRVESSNIEALSLYLKLGFKKIEDKQNKPSSIMELNIKKSVDFLF